MSRERIPRKGDVLQDPAGREARGDRRGGLGSAYGGARSECTECFHGT